MNPESSNNNQTNPRKRPLVEADKDKQPATLNCMVVAIDHNNLFYTVCSICEKTLPDPSPNTHFPNSSSIPFCKYCNFNNNNNGFFNPASSGSKRLFRKASEGEMLKVTLSQPKNGNARHLRVLSVLPLQTGFQPVIETLRELYRARGGS